MNSCLVQFADGFKTVTSRWNVRRLKAALLISAGLLLDGCPGCIHKRELRKGGPNGEGQQNSDLPEPEHRPVPTPDPPATAGAEASDALKPEADQAGGLSTSDPNQQEGPCQ